MSDVTAGFRNFILFKNYNFVFSLFNKMIINRLLNKSSLRWMLANFCWDLTAPSRFYKWLTIWMKYCDSVINISNVESSLTYIVILFSNLYFRGDNFTSVKSWLKISEKIHFEKKIEKCFFFFLSEYIFSFAVV